MGVVLHFFDKKRMKGIKNKTEIFVNLAETQKGTLTSTACSTSWCIGAAKKSTNFFNFIVLRFYIQTSKNGTTFLNFSCLCFTGKRFHEEQLVLSESSQVLP